MFPGLTRAVKPLCELTLAAKRLDLLCKEITLSGCTRLRYAHLACPEGLEPPTCCLEGSCSIQLSYGQLSRGDGGQGPPDRGDRMVGVR